MCERYGAPHVHLPYACNPAAGHLSCAQIFRPRIRAAVFYRASSARFGAQNCARKHTHVRANNSKRLVDSCDRYRRDDIDVRHWRWPAALIKHEKMRSFSFCDDDESCSNDAPLCACRARESRLVARRLNLLVKLSAQRRGGPLWEVPPLH
jgi:hypothetical protein